MIEAISDPEVRPLRAIPLALYVINITDAIQEKPTVDSFTRELCGAVARFERGAQVSKISLPTDFSAARISGLPADSSPESVATLLSRIGIELTPACVRIPRQSGAPYISADIRVEDPAFAKSLCTKLSVTSNLGAKFSELEAVKLPAGIPSGSNAGRVECKKVQCSWYKPSRTAWLNFGNGGIANTVFDKFSSNVYTILNQTVHCNSPTRGAGWRGNPHAWTLMLPGLPASTVEKDIRSAISSPHDSPRHIQLGEPNYDIDGELASATVMSLLHQAGPIEWCQATTELEGKRAKATARFYEESDAREAVRLLHDKPLPFCKNMKLTTQLVSTAKFRVATNIFRAIQSRIHSASQTWKKQHLNYKVFPSIGLGQQYTVLKIEGQVAKDVATAKETMDKILDGVLVMSHGEVLWAPSLNNNGSAFQKLKQIQQGHGVIVVRNRRKAELRLYGSAEKCPAVESVIADMISAESSTDHIIYLKPEEFQWACIGGFKMIATAIGENNATFDIVSTPKKILIGGSEKEYETALRIVRKRDLTLQAETVAGKEECTVCWTQAESPVFTRCNHVYCIECFENLCTAAGSGEKAFSISCYGDKGKCQVVFDLEELQESLSSRTFEDVLEASFASHIQRHPQTFRYCPKPDCGMIYRTTTTMSFNTCTKCLTGTCTSCHNPHEGKTCAEYKDEASGGYEALEKLKKKLGFKDCPRCKTTMEKTEGCNHMKCRGCGAHLCWVCLEAFSESKPCYEHMNAKHGGIGLDYLNHV